MKLENTSYTDNTLVVRRGSILDSGGRGAGVYYGVVATVNSYVTAVADDVARLCLREDDAVSDASHGAGGMGQAHTEVCVYSHNEAGAVGSVG